MHDVCSTVPEKLGKLLLSAVSFLMHINSSKLREPKRRTIAAIHEDILFRAVTVHVTIEQ